MLATEGGRKWGQVTWGMTGSLARRMSAHPLVSLRLASIQQPVGTITS